MTHLATIHFSQVQVTWKHWPPHSSCKKFLSSWPADEPLSLTGWVSPHRRPGSIWSGIGRAARGCGRSLRLALCGRARSSLGSMGTSCSLLRVRLQESLPWRIDAGPQWQEIASCSSLDFYQRQEIMKHIKSDHISWHNKLTWCDIVHQIVQKSAFNYMREHFFSFLFFLNWKQFANLTFISSWIFYNTYILTLCLPKKNLKCNNLKTIKHLKKKNVVKYNSDKS